MIYDSPVFTDAIPILFNLYNKLRISVNANSDAPHMMFFNYAENQKKIWGDNNLKRSNPVYEEESDLQT